MPKLPLAPCLSATLPCVSMPPSGAHRPTGEYRLLLQWTIDMKLSEGQIGCYVFLLGSKQPPRYIGWPEAASWCFDIPVQVHDSLHWYSEIYLSESSRQHQRDSKPVIVFDTIAESFRWMCAPVVSPQANIFDMDGTLGIYRRNYVTKEIDVEPFLKEKETIDIWVLRNYETEGSVWNHDEYRLDVVSVDDGVLVLLLLGEYLTRVDSDGELLENFNIGENPRMTKWRLKQSLIHHTFFSALKGYAVNFRIGR
uniref:F-box associated domain-containing protein n=1 Tax=Aegilops tauschii TaxID=37682 RepID=M8BPP3_AEGTA